MSLVLRKNCPALSNKQQCSGCAQYVHFRSMLIKKFDLLFGQQYFVLYWNILLLGSLSALVYQHSLMPMALPCRLLLPEGDGSRLPTDNSSTISTAQLLLAQGAGEYISSCRHGALSSTVCCVSILAFYYNQCFILLWLLCFSLQRSVPLHSGHRIINRPSSNKEGSSPYVLNKTITNSNSGSLQGVRTGHHTH